MLSRQFMQRYRRQITGLLLLTVSSSDLYAIDAWFDKTFVTGWTGSGWQGAVGSWFKNYFQSNNDDAITLCQKQCSTTYQAADDVNICKQNCQTDNFNAGLYTTYQKEMTQYSQDLAITQAICNINSSFSAQYSYLNNLVLAYQWAQQALQDALVNFYGTAYYQLAFTDKGDITINPNFAAALAQIDSEWNKELNASGGSTIGNGGDTAYGLFGMPCLPDPLPQGLTAADYPGAVTCSGNLTCGLSSIDGTNFTYKYIPSDASPIQGTDLTVAGSYQQQMTYRCLVNSGPITSCANPSQQNCAPFGLIATQMTGNALTTFPTSETTNITLYTNNDINPYRQPFYEYLTLPSTVKYNIPAEVPTLNQYQLNQLNANLQSQGLPTISAVEANIKCSIVPMTDDAAYGKFTITCSSSASGLPGANANGQVVSMIGQSAALYGQNSLPAFMVNPNATITPNTCEAPNYTVPNTTPAVQDILGHPATCTPVARGESNIPYAPYAAIMTPNELGPSLVNIVGQDNQNLIPLIYCMQSSANNYIAMESAFGSGNLNQNLANNVNCQPASCAGQACSDTTPCCQYASCINGLCETTCNPPVCAPNRDANGYRIVDANNNPQWNINSCCQPGGPCNSMNFNSDFPQYPGTVCGLTTVKGNPVIVNQACSKKTACPMQDGNQYTACVNAEGNVCDSDFGCTCWPLCTLNSCLGNPCDDSTQCCNGTACVGAQPGSPGQCKNGSACYIYTDSTCPSNATCIGGEAAKTGTCKDGTVCHFTNNTTCPWNSTCVGGTIAKAGSCTNDATTCAAGSKCSDGTECVGAVAASAGLCSQGTCANKASCNASTPCSDQSTCQYNECYPLQNCDDGSVCTGATAGTPGLCSLGTCANGTICSTASACSDNSTCQYNVCYPTQACADGSTCTGATAGTPGACQFPAPPDCPLYEASTGSGITGKVCNISNGNADCQTDGCQNSNCIGNYNSAGTLVNYTCQPINLPAIYNTDITYGAAYTAWCTAAAEVPTILLGMINQDVDTANFYNSYIVDLMSAQALGQAIGNDVNATSTSGLNSTITYTAATPCSDGTGAICEPLSGAKAEAFWQQGWSNLYQYVYLLQQAITSALQNTKSPIDPNLRAAYYPYLKNLQQLQSNAFVAALTSNGGDIPAARKDPTYLKYSGELTSAILGLIPSQYIPSQYSCNANPDANNPCPLPGVSDYLTFNNTMLPAPTAPTISPNFTGTPPLGSNPLLAVEALEQLYSPQGAFATTPQCTLGGAGATCKADGDCNSGYACLTSGTGAETGQQVAPTGGQTGTCQIPTCAAQIAAPATTCAQDSDCSKITGALCDLNNGICVYASICSVGCSTDSDCTGTLPTGVAWPKGATAICDNAANRSQYQMSGTPSNMCASLTSTTTTDYQGLHKKVTTTYTLNSFQVNVCAGTICSVPATTSAPYPNGITVVSNTVSPQNPLAGKSCTIATTGNNPNSNCCSGYACLGLEPAPAALQPTTCKTNYDCQIQAKCPQTGPCLSPTNPAMLGSICDVNGVIGAKNQCVIFSATATGNNYTCQVPWCSNQAPLQSQTTNNGCCDGTELQASSQTCIPIGTQQQAVNTLPSLPYLPQLSPSADPCALPTTPPTAPYTPTTACQGTTACSKDADCTGAGEVCTGIQYGPDPGGTATIAKQGTCCVPTVSSATRQCASNADCCPGAVCLGVAYNGQQNPDGSPQVGTKGYCAVFMPSADQQDLLAQFTLDALTDNLPAPITRISKNIDLNSVTITGSDIPNVCAQNLYDPAASQFCWEAVCPSVGNMGDNGTCFNFGVLPGVTFSSSGPGQLSAVNNMPLANIMGGAAGSASGGAAGYNGLLTAYNNNANWYRYLTYNNWCTPVTVPSPDQSAPAGSTISTCSGQFPVLEIIQSDMAIDAQIINFIYEAQQQTWKASQFSPPGCNLPQAPQQPTPSPGQFAQNLTSSLFVAPILAGVIGGIVSGSVAFVTSVLVAFRVTRTYLIKGVRGFGNALGKFSDALGDALKPSLSGGRFAMTYARFYVGAKNLGVNASKIALEVKNYLTSWPKVRQFGSDLGEVARYTWARAEVFLRSKTITQGTITTNADGTFNLATRSIDNPAYQEAQNVITNYLAARAGGIVRGSSAPVARGFAADVADPKGLPSAGSGAADGVDVVLDVSHGAQSMIVKLGAKGITVAADSAPEVSEKLAQLALKVASDYAEGEDSGFDALFQEATSNPNLKLSDYISDESNLSDLADELDMVGDDLKELTASLGDIKFLDFLDLLH